MVPRCEDVTKRGDEPRPAVAPEVRSEAASPDGPSTGTCDETGGVRMTEVVTAGPTRPRFVP